MSTISFHEGLRKRRVRVAAGRADCPLLVLRESREAGVVVGTLPLTRPPL